MPRQCTGSCEYCGREFRFSPSEKRRFCSYPCFLAGNYGTPEQRFWSKVEKSSEPDGCWIWVAGLGKGGYGQFCWDGRSAGAHRFSYILHFGDIPDGLDVLHHCDNPPCIRPDHLFAGTNLDNTLDSMAKGRRASGDRNGSRLYPERLKRGDDNPVRRNPEILRRGEQHHEAKLTADAVRAIRIGLDAGETKASLARRFGVSDAVIHSVAKGKTWRHVA